MLIKNLEKLSTQRVLTMSNNRKCDYLVVNCGRKSTFVMGIKNNTYTTDIVLIKEIFSENTEGLVEKIRTICFEFDVHVILLDKRGIGLGFNNVFNQNIPSNIIQIREVDMLSYDWNNGIIKFKDDIEKSSLRLLQSYKCAELSYQKLFLGYSDVMDFHKETDELIKEINNIDISTKYNGHIQIDRINDEISLVRFNCLLMYYTYKYNIENGKYTNKDFGDDNKQKEYDIHKRISQYEIIHGIFYKYMFKAMENEKVKIIFYHSGYNRLQQFKDIIEEEKFRELFYNEIKNMRIRRDSIEIVLNNDSSIKFEYASDGAMGLRYDYVIVDTNIDREVYDNVIRCKGIYDLDKENKGLKDNYYIEFVEM